MNPFDRDQLTQLPEIASAIALLERALEYLRQGRDIEGVSLCMLAREHLAPEQAKIVELLDAFLASHTRYWEAQQALHEAGRRFVQAETEQQGLRLAVEQLLPALHQERRTSTPGIKDQLSHTAQRQPSSPPFTPSPAGPEHRSPPDTMLDHAGNTSLALSMTLFGSFQVRRQGQQVMLCQNRNGRAILRYLAAQPEYRATTDTLMTLLWPEDETEVARHKLQVAVSALRHSLNQGVSRPPAEGYILHKNEAYQLNPAVSLPSDVEQFLALYQRGRHSSGEEAITSYEQACRLYTGPFLVEDLYADWSAAQRQHLCQCFLTMCRALAGYYLDTGRYEEAERWGRAALRENRCDEEAHRVLIRNYLAQGWRSEAVRQYQTCVRILAEELGVSPMTETVMIGRSIPTYEHRAKIERV